MIKVLVEVNRCLNALLIDLLAKIAVPIQQTDRDEIQIEIAGRLAMIAREDAQATRVVRNRFVETEFSRKICDWILDRAAGTGFAVRVLASQIFRKFLKDLLELTQEVFVLRKFF